MSFLNKVLQGFLGDKNAKDLKEIKKVVDKIKKVEPAIAELSDDELRAKTQEFKDKIDAATEHITNQVVEVHEQIAKSSDVDEKEKLFGQIETLKKDSYQIEEKVFERYSSRSFCGYQRNCKKIGSKWWTYRYSN